MNKRFVVLMALCAVFALVAAAADISGKWVAQVPGRDGQTRETTFDLKADGSTLTGTMAGPQGQPVEIKNGKISGDTVTFVVTMERGGNTMTWNYTGTVSGDEIKMKREGTQGQPREFVAKRSK